LLTDVDMVALQYPGATITLGGLAARGSFPSNGEQAAALVSVPRRIKAATRIRWKYLHDNVNAATGNYVLSLYDASGRKIVDPGSVAVTGAASSVQVRSETITATDFEPGVYYLLIGSTLTAGLAYYEAAELAVIPPPGSGGTHAAPSIPNVGLRSA